MADSANTAGFRLDDDLKKPTRGGEDARDPGGDREHTDEPRSDAQVNERSDLARFLDPSVYPANKWRLIEDAESHFAPAWVLDRLRVLPDDAQFDTLEQVWEASGGRPPDPRP
jgi:hypothetical protein